MIPTPFKTCLKFQLSNQPLKFPAAAGETAERIEIGLARGAVDIWRAERDGSYLLLASLALQPAWLRETTVSFSSDEDQIRLTDLVLIGRRGAIAEVTVFAAEKISGK
ncbi:hypothetical protein [uncultured Paludibaculum sp.]|uniref:hypothetical protein n=1 Tax=uncultured Paludibaculum sp. TaxID=1765020 RepID=UPI002AAAC8E8|nr:hypothetical protein [uncultured Paludibaculum sp.]